MENDDEIVVAGNSNNSIEKSEDDILAMFGSDFQREVVEIRNHLKLTRNFVESVIGGVHKNAILEGPPGLGKSHVVAQALKAAGKVERKDYFIVKGHVTPINLFVLLGLLRNPGQVLVLDDCDDVFQSELGFNMLKAALDPDNRYVSYQSQRIPIIKSLSEILCLRHSMLKQEHLCQARRNRPKPIWRRCRLFPTNSLSN